MRRNGAPTLRILAAWIWHRRTEQARRSASPSPHCCTQISALMWKCLQLDRAKLRRSETFRAMSATSSVGRAARLAFTGGGERWGSAKRASAFSCDVGARYWTIFWLAEDVSMRRNISMAFDGAVLPAFGRQCRQPRRRGSGSRRAFFTSYMILARFTNQLKHGCAVVFHGIYGRSRMGDLLAGPYPGHFLSRARCITCTGRTIRELSFASVLCMAPAPISVYTQQTQSPKLALYAARCPSPSGTTGYTLWFWIVRG
jgi:hypothetical protein